MSADHEQNNIPGEILKSLTKLQEQTSRLASTVDALSQRLDFLAGVKHGQDAQTDPNPADEIDGEEVVIGRPGLVNLDVDESKTKTISPSSNALARHPSMNSRIILTTYPGKANVDPIGLIWGESDAAKRGPVVVGRSANTIRRRNGRSLISVLLSLTYCHRLHLQAAC